MPGRETLEQRIEHFEFLLEQMKEQTREAHSVLKEIRQEKKEIERLFKADEVEQRVRDRVHEVVGGTLEEIGPEINRQTTALYNRVGEQVEILINICLGKPGKVKGKSVDLRPILGARLRTVINEIMEDYSSE